MIFHMFKRLRDLPINLFNTECLTLKKSSNKSKSLPYLTSILHSYGNLYVSQSSSEFLFNIHFMKQLTTLITILLQLSFLCCHTEFAPTYFQRGRIKLLKGGGPHSPLLGANYTPFSPCPFQPTGQSMKLSRQLVNLVSREITICFSTPNK